MATTKKRINISLPREDEKMITELAKRDQMPAATKAGELLRMAIEIEEDQIWDKMASERDTKDAKFLSHEEVWG